MKSAREVAIDAAREAFGLGGWSRETFLVMLQDKCETGVSLRRAVDVFERAIEADRRVHASLHAPS